MQLGFIVSMLCRILIISHEASVEEDRISNAIFFFGTNNKSIMLFFVHYLELCIFYSFLLIIFLSYLSKIKK